MTTKKTSESAGRAVALKDDDLDAAVGGLSATGKGNIKTPAFKVEIEGATSASTPSTTTASFDEADALFGK